MRGAPATERRGDLAAFDVSAERGFLPRFDPVTALPRAFAAWSEVGRELPKLLAAGRVAWAVDRLPHLDPAPLRPAEQRWAMVVLSFLAHAYLVELSDRPRPRVLPAAVAAPWQALAAALGRPPVLSYASYALDNWRRIDPDGPIAAGNLALGQNFLGGLDEEWFVVVHVDIEARAAPAIAALWRAVAAAAADDAAALADALGAVAAGLDAMGATLARMPERCDPYIYFHRVRPYIHGTNRDPVVYAGVDAFGVEPRGFFGETGAQSAIVPALDAGLGIIHGDDELKWYLDRMRDYMPPGHRALLTALEARSRVRALAGRLPASDPARLAYDACVEGVERFRSKHLEYAAAYIDRQVATSAQNPTAYGTGGTPFMDYLSKHRDETAAHRLGA
ncbi:MAG TPA: hypothetical protein VGL23_00450 [Chloroflexota bacterium]